MNKVIIMNWWFHDRTISRRYQFPEDTLLFMQEFVNLMGNPDVNELRIFKREE